MKKLVTLLTMFLLVSSTIKSQDEVFEKLADTKGVDVVHISETMLRMMPNISTGGMNIGNIVSKLNSITILSAETSKSVDIMRKEANAVVKRGYESTMYIKDDDSKTAFYFKKDRNNVKNEILMFMDEGDEITLIRIIGNITAEDIRTIAPANNINLNIRTGGNKGDTRRYNSEQHEQTMKNAQRQREQAQKQREQALKQGEEARKEAQKRREEALRQGEEARKQGEEARKQAMKEAEKARKESMKAVEEARKQTEEARKQIDKQIEEMRKNMENENFK